MNVPAKSSPTSDIMEQVIIKGDLARLTPEERVRYYSTVCRSLGLNPYTRPIEFINLSGRLTLYVKRDATDQMRKHKRISLEIVKQDLNDGLFTVHVRGIDRDGRKDEDFGVVSLPDNLKGDARANQILKCVTKAKRRVTLSLSGLGWLDESEIDEVEAGAVSHALTDETGELISAGEIDQINKLMEGYSPQGVKMFLDKYGIGSVDELPRTKVQEAVDALTARNKMIAERTAATNNPQPE